VITPADEPLRHVQALLEGAVGEAGIRARARGLSPARIRIDCQQFANCSINLVTGTAPKPSARTAPSRSATRVETRRLAGRATPVVVLEAEDTGKGIPPESRSGSSTPFFSTKDAGTGLGWPSPHASVEKHGGALQYQTQVNRGTTFGVVLPRVDRTMNPPVKILRSG